VKRGGVSGAQGPDTWRGNWGAKVMGFSWVLGAGGERGCDE
jgi:hypothetical protein